MGSGSSGCNEFCLFGVFLPPTGSLRSMSDFLSTDLIAEGGVVPHKLDSGSSRAPWPRSSTNQKNVGRSTSSLVCAWLDIFCLIQPNSKHGRLLFRENECGSTREPVTTYKTDVSWKRRHFPSEKNFNICASKADTKTRENIVNCQC